MTGKSKNGVVIEPTSATPDTHVERATQSAATESLMTQHTAPTAAQPADELAQLRAEQKAIAARVKELRAATPVVSKLGKVIAAQEAGPGNKWIAPHYARLIAKRVALGQPAAEAFAAVQALWVQWTSDALAQLATAPTSASAS
jgi:hypothetical protein